MEEARGSTGVGRVIATGIGLYLVAILIARLVIAGGLAWVLLVALSLTLLLILTSRAGFVFALVAVGLVGALALAFRLVMLSGLGWPALLLLPVVAGTAVIAGRVIAAMRSDRRAAAHPEELAKDD